MGPLGHVPSAERCYVVLTGYHRPRKLRRGGTHPGRRQHTATAGAWSSLELIKDASIELADVVGTILKANSNEYVALFEG
jgi:hypothetical protein